MTILVLPSVSKVVYASCGSRFEDIKLEVYAFITDVELRLISLDPYTSEEEPRQQLEKLKVRRHCSLRKNYVTKDTTFLCSTLYVTVMSLKTLHFRKNYVIKTLKFTCKLCD